MTKIIILSVLAIISAACRTPSASAPNNSSVITTPASFVTPSPVDVVRNGILTVELGDGTFRRYDSTTVGKAFEGTFQNTKWTSFTGKKGENVVQFDGTIKALQLLGRGFGFTIHQTTNELLNDCIAKLGFTPGEGVFWNLRSSDFLKNDKVQKCVGADVVVPIQIQFIISAGTSKSFYISYFQRETFSDLANVLEFIYG